jgi:hypothetical protein
MREQLRSKWLFLLSAGGMATAKAKITAKTTATATATADP